MPGNAGQRMRPRQPVSVRVGLRRLAAARRGGLCMSGAATMGASSSLTQAQARGTAMVTAEAFFTCAYGTAEQLIRQVSQPYPQRHYSSMLPVIHGT